MRTAFLLLAPICALSVGATTASADVCLVMDRATAEAFAQRLEAAGSFIHGDWFSPITVEAIDIVTDGDLFTVWVNGVHELDAAYTYVPGDDGTYANVGLPLGCEGADVTPTVPREPFGADMAAAPAVLSADTARLIGIVEAPALHEAYLAMAELSVPVALRGAPTTSAPIAAEVAALDQLETAEIDYERLGAAAYGVDLGWYQVRQDGRPLWLPPEAAGALHRYPDLLLESLSYLDLGWNGRLYATPRADAARTLLHPSWRATMGDAIDIDVRGLWVEQGVPWMLVDIIWPNPCDGADPAVVATGWVPAYDAGGAPSAWFYSRGC